ncbi:MAG: DNA topoisomerase 4 subunit A, partial [Ureaplasma sp.]|nr:DNA topoisomerase 4 subunit A [Ureaplasma sp.]
MDKKNTIINQSLATIMSDCFGRYAKYVIQDRALPDIRDGLKPVQRRILYAMGELGLFHNKQYKKSARTVGEVIGKYHPHGDSSIYEAMVRMSQDWKNNLPLLDMHGNNGSIDGDSAAAMRYTETRLSEVSTIMLDNIKKNIVEFTLNFDDTEKEPTVLPSLFPNLLINGCVGIAAGYATNIPTHNPKEVFDALIYRIKTPNSSLSTIMKIIPGPDFPTGGIINTDSGLKDAFETGRGKFVISSKIEFNESNSKINQIVIKEIPYDTNKSIIIKELNDIMYDEKIPGILEIRDESDKNGVSIVIDVKKDKNLELIKNYLLKNTKLQVNYSTNFVVILNKKPTIVPLLTAFDSYIEFAISIIVKTAEYDLEKASKRAEILLGLIKAIKIIDKVIAVIRSSESKEDAKNNLMKKWEFSQIQAEAIVSLQLYKLTKTDINQLKEEVDELTKTIEYLQNLISNQELQKDVLIEK